MDLQTPQPKLPDGISIMEQFKLITAAMFKYVMGPPPRPTGAVNMIRPDGTQPAPMGYTGKAINIPWGLNVDGNDDVWVGNMWGRSVTLLAGDNTAGHPAGTKTGDVIHVFQSGSIQMITDASIDPAGNVWAANNWNSLEAAAGQTRPVPPRPGAAVRASPSSTAWRHRCSRRALARCAGRKASIHWAALVVTGCGPATASQP